MKEQIIYISSDNKRFDSKYECLNHEKFLKEDARNKKWRVLKAKLESEYTKRDLALGWLSGLKSPERSTGDYIVPTMYHIDQTSNLPRIEAIYRKAKANFLKVLNERQDNFKIRVAKIKSAAQLLDYAIQVREDLIAKFYETKKALTEAQKNIGELEKEKAKVLKSLNGEDCDE